MTAELLDGQTDGRPDAQAQARVYPDPAGPEDAPVNRAPMPGVLDEFHRVVPGTLTAADQDAVLDVAGILAEILNKIAAVRVRTLATRSSKVRPAPGRASQR